MSSSQHNGISPQRLAAVLALLMFALCLVIGVLRAGNTFTTAVWRALVAMAGTFVIGLIAGAMGQKVLDDNARSEAEKLKESEAKSVMEDR
jgi:hypothetical protein